MKKRLLVFHSALTPYRIDFFNALAEHFECTVVFVSRNNINQPFEQEELFKKCLFKRDYLDMRIQLPQNRVMNFGYMYRILKYKPDIVIGAEYGLPTLLPYLYKKLFHLKYTLYTICDDSLNIAITGGSRVRRELRDFLIKRLNGVILVSDKVAEWYSSHFKLKQRPIVFPIIYNETPYRAMLQRIIPISKTYQEQYDLINKKVVLFVGRLTEVKNIPLLIQAFAQLHTDDNARLVIVGDGDMRENLLSMAQKAGMENKIIFPGRFEGDKLYAWYNIADLFVLPSTYEPFGAVIVEALEAGCPVLCSERAGSATLINSRDGQIFNPENEKDLSSLLSQYIEKIEYKDIDSKAARPSLLPCSFHDSVKNMIELLH